jgi:site-specific DNA-methyltransferase (adenine-specific)
MIYHNLPEKQYKMIMADPPWDYNDKVRSSTNGGGGASRHYETLTVASLGRFPMANLAEDDSVLLLWTTFPMYWEACSLMEFWGFKYKTACWVWAKTTKDGKKFAMGMGHYSRANPEVCLLGVRGKGLKVLRHDILNLQTHPRLKHSEKPTLFHDLSVELFGNVPRIDLFARKRVKGWDSWGKELED